MNEQKWKSASKETVTKVDDVKSNGKIRKLRIGRYVHIEIEWLSSRTANRPELNLNYRNRESEKENCLPESVEIG